MNSKIRNALNAMIAEMREKEQLFSAGIEKAISEVERHRFIPVIYLPKDGKLEKFSVNAENPEEFLLKEVYKNTPLIIDARGDKVISTSSQPGVMAMMLKAIRLGPGMKVLEIGTGSGYNAAVMSEMTGSGANIYTIEVLENVGESARANLKGAGYDDVNVIIDDGGKGYASAAPYDAVIVTCSASTITASWIEQLKTGGYLSAPLATRGMETLVEMEKTADGSLKGVATHYVRFIKFDSTDTTINHDYMVSSDRASLSRLIKKHAVEHKELTERVKGLERTEMLDFQFFLALSCEDAICFYDEEEENSPRSYGIWKKSIGEGGIVLMQSDKVISQGSTKITDSFGLYFDKWKALGKPGLSDYELEFSQGAISTELGENEWLIKRKDVSQIARLKS